MPHHRAHLVKIHPDVDCGAPSLHDARSNVRIHVVQDVQIDQASYSCRGKRSRMVAAMLELGNLRAAKTRRLRQGHVVA